MLSEASRGGPCLKFQPVGGRTRQLVLYPFKVTLAYTVSSRLATAMLVRPCLKTQTAGTAVSTRSHFCNWNWGDDLGEALPPSFRETSLSLWQHITHLLPPVFCQGILSFPLLLIKTVYQAQLLNSEDAHYSLFYPEERNSVLSTYQGLNNLNNCFTDKRAFLGNTVSKCQMI